MTGADGAVEAFAIQGWLWIRRHWELAFPAMFLTLTGAMVSTGDYWPAIVTLTVGTVAYYGLAKAEAIEKEQSTTKG